ncbi:MAG: enoyl-CoA hydratase-related protein [Hyphomicrobiaceae bacterium]|nr:enoyl-CoA hydratase-related protein [Hyphomicrobiaceae bacterium]
MPDQFQQIIVRVAERVATITLSRPERLNAWTAQMADELAQALQSLASSDEVRAIVITGAGKGFCAGADMEKLSSAAKGNVSLIQEAAAGAGGLAANFAQRCSYLLGIPKPIIAAINGPVAGIGLVIATFCDIRYMAAGAKLTTAFARRGLVAEHGMAWLLPKLIGPMNALDLLYSARPVAAEEAERMGLVRVLPAEGFLAAVEAKAAEIANLSSPRATAIIKRQVYEAFFQTLAEATQIANREQEACRDTEDFKEGVASFLERRPPRFTGR